METISENKLDVFILAKELVKQKIDIFQLRAKNICNKELLRLAVKLAKIIHKKGKTFIVNDSVDIAHLAGADGVHVGKEDIPPKEARKILGKRKIIGITIHSLEELKRFEKESVDYLSVGPVFKTKVKPTLPPLGIKKLKAIIKKTKKPVFAVGGINLNNINFLTKIPVKNIALCRGIILSKNLKATVEKFRAGLAQQVEHQLPKLEERVQVPYPAV